MKLPKKAQMEMIGLVVIVILITLGMLFMAQFALKKDSKKKIFVREGLASSTISALLKLDVKCEYIDTYGKKVKTPLSLGKNLIDDCAENQGSQSDFPCDGKHTCTFLNETINRLLNKTLGTWNKHYQFKSTLLYGQKPITLLDIKDSSGKGCPRERDTSGLFPLNTQLGIVENVLYLCD